MTAPSIAASAAITGFGDTAVFMPTHSAGQLLIHYGGWADVSTLDATPAGWTALFADVSDGSTPDLGHFCLWKEAASSAETLTVVEDTGDGRVYAGVTIAITAGTYDLADPFDGLFHGATGSGTNPQLPGVTPSDTRDRLLLSGARHNAASPPGTSSVAGPWTKIAQGADDFAIAMLADRTWLVGTAYDGSVDWTYAVGNDWRAFSVLINPATAGITEPRRSWPRGLERGLA